MAISLRLVATSLALSFLAGCDQVGTSPQPVGNTPPGGNVAVPAAPGVGGSPGAGGSQIVAGVGADGEEIRYGDSVPFQPLPVGAGSNGTGSNEGDASPIEPPRPGGGVKVGVGTPVGRFAPLDLSSKANLELEKPARPGGISDGLADLPTGPGTYDGIPFTVAPKYLHVGSQSNDAMPNALDGIPVGRTVGKLHFLHSCAFSGLGKPGPKQPDGSVIGGYIVHYTDGTTAEVPVHYGRDVRDWWNWDGNAPTSPGRIAWEGENSYAKKLGKNIRLYHGVWANPSPAKPVQSIDFRTAGSIAAPFCVAITIEGS